MGGVGRVGRGAGGDNLAYQYTCQRAPPLPESDTAPTTIITAPARTARPTPVVTATGTIAPTPTTVGLWIWDETTLTGVDCEQAAQTPVATIPWAALTPMPAQSTPVAMIARICNLNNYPITVSWRTRVEVDGAGTAASKYNYCFGTCDPAWPDWYTAQILNAATCTGGIGGAHEEFDETRIVTLYPFVQGGASDKNNYAFNLYANASALVGCPGTGEIQWDIVPVWGANPPSPQPTRDASIPAKITEIMGRQQGTVCGNWNLRGVCDAGDQFVEIMTGVGAALAGWRIDIVDGTDAVVCTYTIAADNWTDPLKAFWQDLMRTPAGELCGQWPETGRSSCTTRPATGGLSQI